VSNPEAVSDGTILKQCTDKDGSLFGAMYLPIHETAMRVKRRRDDEERDKDDEATDRFLHTRDYDLHVEPRDKSDTQETKVKKNEKEVRKDRIFVRIVDDEETGAKAALWQRINGSITAERRRAVKMDRDYEHESSSHIPPDEILIQVRPFTAKEKQARTLKLSKFVANATSYLSQSSAWGEEDAPEDQSAEDLVDPMDEDVVAQVVQPQVVQRNQDDGLDITPAANADLIAELGM